MEGNGRDRRGNLSAVGLARSDAQVVRIARDASAKFMHISFPSSFLGELLEIFSHKIDIVVPFDAFIRHFVT